MKRMTDLKQRTSDRDEIYMYKDKNYEKQREWKRCEEVCSVLRKIERIP